MSEEHVHAGVVGEALVSGHFPALVPGQCAHRLVGQALDAAGERVTDLVGFPTQRQGDDDQVAGGALNQGRAALAPSWPMIRSPSQLPGIFRSAMSGRSSINRIPTMGGLRPPVGGFLRIHRREGKQMPCSMSVFLGWA